MTIDSVKKLSNLIDKPGAAFDFGCKENEINQFIEIAHKHHLNKGVCAVRNWMIWDLEADLAVTEKFHEQGVQPTLLYAGFVVLDSSMRFETGSYVMSTPLVTLVAPCFFVTRNTVYILVDSGTRKSVDPHSVRAFYF